MKKFKRLIDALRGGGDTVRITGKVRMVLRDADGSVLIDKWHKNLVVNTGKYHIADQLAAQAEGAMSHMAIGTGSAAVAAAGDTTL